MQLTCHLFRVTHGILAGQEGSLHFANGACHEREQSMTCCEEKEPRIDIVFLRFVTYSCFRKVPGCMEVAIFERFFSCKCKVSQSVADQWLIIESFEPKLESRPEALVKLTASLWCDALSAMLPRARTTQKFRSG